MLELAHPAAAFALGLYAGSLLTEGAILVPYWRKMDPAEFFRLHGELGPSLFRYYAPLTTIAVLLAVVSASLSAPANDISIGRTIAAAGGLATIAIFFVYFSRANRSFSDRSLTDEELGPELKRWAAWHWARTLIILATFAASMAALP